MRKILLVLATGLLCSGCVFGFGLRHRYGESQIVVHHVHGDACGHVFVNGIWILK